MAQNSIARLAVQIVTDTGGMNEGFRRAQVNTIRFANSVNGSNASLARLGKVSTDAVKSLSGLGGPAGLAFKFAGIVGPVGLAATAVALLAGGMVRAAVASEDLRIERLRELGRISPDIKTTAESLRLVGEQLGVLNELAVKSIVGDGIKGLGVDFAQALKAINEKLLFGEKAVSDLMKERAVAADNNLLKLKQRADELTKSLRSPMEVFFDTTAELIKMREEGFITADVLSRGAKKAAEDFRRLVEKKREAVGVPALEIGTAGARTAILSSGAKSDSPAMREVAATLRRIEALEREGLKKPTVTFKAGAL